MRAAMAGFTSHRAMTDGIAVQLAGFGSVVCSVAGAAIRLLQPGFSAIFNRLSDISKRSMAAFTGETNGLVDASQALSHFPGMAFVTLGCRFFGMMSVDGQRQGGNAGDAGQTQSIVGMAVCAQYRL